MTLATFFSWVSFAAACDPEVHYWNLQVDTSAVADGAGSECSPFNSLASALTAAQPQPTSTISLLSSLSCVTLEKPALISSELVVEGHGNCVHLLQSISIGVFGKLVLRQVHLQETEAGLEVKGELRLVQVVASSVGAWRLYVEGGRVALEQCFVANSTSEFIRIRDSGLSSVSVVSILDCEVRGNSATLVTFTEDTYSPAITTIANSTIETGELLSGIMRNAEVSLFNSTLTSLNHILHGSVLASNVVINNCTITNIANPPITLYSLKGSVTITHSTIHSIAQGPIVLLLTNAYPADSAFLRIDTCTVWNVTNFDVRQSAAAFFITSATALLTNTEVRSISVSKSGLARVVAGALQVANVHYHDSSVGVSSILEASLSFLSVANLTVQRVENNDESGMMMLKATVATLTNVSVVDSIDARKLQFDDRILIGAWYMCRVIVHRSYFNNPGDGFNTMGAFLNTTITITDSVFDNNQLVNAFIIGESAQIVLRNVTFRDLTAKSLVFCLFADFCGDISNMHFEGRTQVDVIFYMSTGAAILSDTVLQGATLSVAKLNNGLLRVHNASFIDCDLRLCESCMVATLELRGILILHSTANRLLELTLSQVEIVDFTVIGTEALQLFQLDSTNVTLSGLSVRSTSVSALGGILSADESSIVTIKSSWLEAITGKVSIANGLIYIRQSELIIANTSATHFNTTLIYSVESKLNISSCEFADAGLLDQAYAYSSLEGGVLKVEAALAVSISNSSFTNISATDGGALYFSSRTRSSRVYDLRSLTIRNCSAAELGGGIYGVKVSLRVTSSVFEGNAASRGAGAWVASSSLSLSGSRFAYNSAALDGGGLQYIDTSLSCSDLSFNNNSAVYGPDVASQVQHIFVLSAEREVLANYSVVTASGQWIKQSIMLGLFDAHSQLITTDNSSQLTLKPTSDSDTLQGSVLLYPQGGVYRATNLIATGKLLSGVRVEGVLASLSDYVFTLHLRDCEVGEERTDSRCTLCTNNMYSLHPSRPCALCVPHATCTDGYKLTLSRGFWRSSTATDKVYKCLAKHLCMGGFEMHCAEGHGGVMCNECAEGFYKGSQLQCFRCKSKEVAGMKAALSVSTALAAVLYASSHGPEACTALFVVADYFSTMRVFSNLNVYWPDTIGYVLIVLGDTGSMGMTAFTDSCLGSVESMSPVYFQAVASVAFVSSLLLVFGLLSAGFRKTIRHFSQLSTASVVLTTGACMLPLLFMRAVQLFSCYEIDGTYRLVIDPSETCWTAKHKKYAFGVGLPVVLCSLILAAYLSALSTQCIRRLHPVQPLAPVLVSVTLVRSFAASSYFVLSNSLVLSSQAGVTLLLNLAADTHLVDTTQSRAAGTIYNLTLSSSTLFVFICLLYESTAEDPSAEQAGGYAAAMYIVLTLPLLLYAAGEVWRALERRRVGPVPAANCAVFRAIDSFLPVPEQSLVSASHKEDSSIAT